MKNRDFRSADRDKTLNSGTVPAKPGRMVGLLSGKFWLMYIESLFP